MQFGDWHLAEITVTVIETVGILVIALGVLVAALATLQARLADPAGNNYLIFRREMSRWLLLGLELLIAADVIRTVTLDLDLANVAALGLLVLIRTFLVWSIVLENEGRWPWQRSRAGDAGSEI